MGLRSNRCQTTKPIHEKYLSGHDTFLGLSKYMTDSDRGAGDLPVDVPGISGGVDILDYKSRVEFGCKLLGYNASQGCVP